MSRGASDPIAALENLAVITKIAHEVLDQQQRELADAVQTLCVRRRIACDDAVVRKAIESAQGERGAR